jgi:hypothetical protein
LKSSDDGITWQRFGTVGNPDGEGGEPTIAEAKARQSPHDAAHERRPALVRQKH